MNISRRRFFAGILALAGSRALRLPAPSQEPWRYAITSLPVGQPKKSVVIKDFIRITVPMCYGQHPRKVTIVGDLLS